ncbi:MAG: transposase [Gammaproteobacteria bacterium]
MRARRRYSEEFKRQVCEEYLSQRAGVAQLSRRHELSPSLIRVWIGKYEQGGYAGDAQPSIQEKQWAARVAELERKIGQLTLENDLLKKLEEQVRRQKNARPSVISGPGTSPLSKAAK